MPPLVVLLQHPEGPAKPYSIPGEPGFHVGVCDNLLHDVIYGTPETLGAAQLQTHLQDPDRPRGPGRVTGCRCSNPPAPRTQGFGHPLKPFPWRPEKALDCFAVRQSTKDKLVFERRPPAATATSWQPLLCALCWGWGPPAPESGTSIINAYYALPSVPTFQQGPEYISAPFRGVGGAG